MRATAPCLHSKGFWKRSLDEFKRYANIIIKQETIKGPQGPYILQPFDDPDSIKDCIVASDASQGGFSSGHLDWVPLVSASSSSSSPSLSSSTSSQFTDTEAKQHGYARFHGVINPDLPKNKPEVHRSGWAAWRTRQRGATIFGRSSLDIDPYIYLALRIKSDGRAYLVNIQTESLVPTDLHQHRLFARRPGEWETVFIKFNDFVRTNYGQPVEPQSEIMRQKVRTFGIGLTDRVPGPFELCIESMWATTRNEEEVDKQARLWSTRDSDRVSTSLKTRSGKKVKWMDDDEYDQK